MAISGKKIVAGANLVALTAFFAPVSISAASETDSEENIEKQNKIEQRGYTCEDTDCKICMAVDCSKMDDFCIKPCEDVLNNDIDLLTSLDKPKKQKLAVMQRNFNTKNR